MTLIDLTLLTAAVASPDRAETSTHDGNALPSPRVAGLAAERVRDARDHRERAVRIHDFVRDHVRFGFRWRFDGATPEQTLDARRGHCNPKGALFVALARAAGLPARQRRAGRSSRTRLPE